MRLEKAEDQDAILLLTGESIPERKRSELAARIYSHVNQVRDSPLPVLVSGCHPWQDVPEGDQIKSYLSDIGVREGDIHLEKESLDTLANFVLSEPILRDLGARRIALVTDEFHMRRASRLGRRVLGGEYSITPFRTAERRTPAYRIIEAFALHAIEGDLAGKGILPGDNEALQEYLRREDPFHTVAEGNPLPLNRYGLGVRFRDFFRKDLHKFRTSKDA